MLFISKIIRGIIYALDTRKVSNVNITLQSISILHARRYIKLIEMNNKVVVVVDMK